MPRDCSAKDPDRPVFCRAHLSEETSDWCHEQAKALGVPKEVFIADRLDEVMAGTVALAEDVTPFVDTFVKAEGKERGQVVNDLLRQLRETYRKQGYPV